MCNQGIAYDFLLACNDDHFFSPNSAKNVDKTTSTRSISKRKTSFGVYVYYNNVEDHLYTILQQRSISTTRKRDVEHHITLTLAIRTCVLWALCEIDDEFLSLSPSFPIIQCTLYSKCKRNHCKGESEQCQLPKQPNRHGFRWYIGRSSWQDTRHGIHPMQTSSELWLSRLHQCVGAWIIEEE